MPLDCWIESQVEVAAYPTLVRGSFLVHKPLEYREGTRIRYLAEHNRELSAMAHRPVF